MPASNPTTSGGGHSADGNLAATYTLIHAFLKSRSHDKAAAALRKAARDTVILRDDVQPDETPLDEIIKWWKQRKAPANASRPNPHASSSESDSSKSSSTSSSSSDGDSSDSSTSSSSDDDSDDSSDSGTSADSDSDSPSSSDESRKDTKVNVQIKPSVSSDSDSTDGSSSDSDSASSSSSSSSDSDSSSTSSTESKPSNGALQPKKTSVNGKPTRPTIKKADSASSSSTSSTESKPSNGALQPENTSVNGKPTRPTIKKEGSRPKSEETSPEEKNDSTRVTKKRRISESGGAVATAEVTEMKNAVSSAKSNGKAREKGPRKNNEPFRFIKAETVEFHDDRLKDNSYVSKGGSTGDYGAQANRDLIVTRGDGFRKEKNKKKRGSYRGGEITMQSHSVKF